MAAKLLNLQWEQGQRGRDQVKQRYPLRPIKEVNPFHNEGLTTFLPKQVVGRPDVIPERNQMVSRNVPTTRREMPAGASGAGTSGAVLCPQPAILETMGQIPGRFLASRL